MRQRSLRAQLLRLLLLPVAAILALGSVGAYYLALEPATSAYDASLVNSALALGEAIRVRGGVATVELPSDADRVLRTDRFDKIYYVVRDPTGVRLAGDAGIPPPPADRLYESPVFYDAHYRGATVRAVRHLAACGENVCSITVAETTRKRAQLVRDILLGSVLPQALLAAMTLVIVWFGVARGLAPLERLSNEIRRRSARDLRPIEEAQAPEEAKPLIDSLNGLLVQVGELHRNQQRFLANAAHQLRTPLAGLQAHAELALARAEPGGRTEPNASVELRALVEGAADEWVHRALERDIDFGLELEPASVQGDPFLLREAVGNLVHNALEYVPAGGHVTVRTGAREGGPFIEVEDDGPGIAPAERARVIERFYRAPGTPGTGSGLGLSIVREIAAAHGGTLEIGDGPHGKGCTVAIKFASQTH